MSGTRLFIGGLSLDLPESVLHNEFSQFGTVTKLDIKEKKDIVTDAIVKRFAFVTLDTQTTKIDQCIASLHGKDLDGSCLSVGRAQESFIEKLKREREAKAQGITIPQADYTQNSQHTSYIKPEVASNFSRSDDGWKQNYSHDEVPETDYKLQKSQFKTPEESWRESVIEQNNQVKEKSSKVSSPKTNVRFVASMPRYDPTKAAAPTAAPAAAQPGKNDSTVSKALVFTGASASFSILDMMSNAAPTDSSDDDSAAMDVTQSSVIPKKTQSRTISYAEPETTHDQLTVSFTPYVKKFKFFMTDDDPEVEENMRWIYQKPDESRLMQFQDDRSQIMKFIVDRCRKGQSNRKTNKKEESWKRTESDRQSLLVTDKLRATSHLVIKPQPVQGLIKQGNKFHEKRKKNVPASVAKGKNAIDKHEKNSRKIVRPVLLR